jgi:phosphoglycerate dehydrogenase-like enzyme
MDNINDFFFKQSITIAIMFKELEKEVKRASWFPEGSGYRANIVTYTIDRGHEYNNISLVKDLKELINHTDIIICSVPKTIETNNLFDDEVFKLMQNKFIVNVGRSNVIDQKALYNALEEGYIGGAAIDTWEEKPKNKGTKLMPSNYSFHNLNNIILSPHAAMRVANGHERYVVDVTNNVIDLITKGEVRNIISYKKGY